MKLRHLAAALMDRYHLAQDLAAVTAERDGLAKLVQTLRAAPAAVHESLRYRDVEIGRLRVELRAERERYIALCADFDEMVGIP